MTRKFSLTAFAATQCLVFGLATTAPARAADIPQYFFSQWTVTANCTEAHAGPAARVQAGLQFKIASQPARHSKSAGTVAMAVPARYSSFTPFHAPDHCCPAALMAWRR